MSRILTDEFTERMQSLDGADFEALERREDGDAYNFVRPTEALQGVYRGLSLLKDRANSIRIVRNNEFPDFSGGDDLVEISGQQMDVIENIAKDLQELIQQITDFESRANSQAPTQHKDICNRSKSLYQRKVEFIQPILRDIEFKEAKPQEVNVVLSELAQRKKAAEEAANQIEKMRDRIQVALTEQGAIIANNDFKEQAKQHKSAAKWWLLATFCAIILTFTLTISLFVGQIFGIDITALENVSIEENPYSVFQIGILKIVLLSLTYLVVYQALRNYKAHCHLATINRHRQLALTVYPFMVNAAEGDQEQIKQIVTHAAKAIFDQGTTGYLSKGGDSPNPINLTEIINKIASDH